MNGEPDLYIGGRWRHASDAGTREIVNPADGSIAAVVDEATDADARDAVQAARAAFDDGAWPATPVAERAALLMRIADLLQRDREDLSLLETRDTGKTLAESRIDIDDVTSVFRYYAKLVGVQADRVIDVGDPDVISRVVREPIGVCVLIAPWNYPLLQMSWKIAPALGAGCTMVAKPSEVTPLSTIAFVHLLEEAGVPGGVVNLVQGSGAALGAALTDNGDVDFISFTGGLATGRTISKVAAEHVTKVAVELGGKNPHIVFADIGTGDGWDAAVDQVLTGVFLHSGQVCSAGTRLIVEESIADDFVTALVARAEKIRVGDGMDPASETGPLVSEQHRAKVEAHVASAISEGATLVTGGSIPNAVSAAGCYIQPTVFADVTDDMTIAREEIFGPVMAVLGFTDEADVIARANATEYGLAAGVFTSDLARAHRVIGQLEAGTCWINTYNITPVEAPFGGVKQSGVGRENSRAALDHYSQIKSVYVATGPVTAAY